MKKTIILKAQKFKDRAKQLIDFLPEDEVHEVEFRPFKDSKTLRQLKTTHGWFREVTDAFHEMGKMYTFPSVKHYFKDMFGVVIEHETPSGIRVELKSFKDYKIDEMAIFMDKCYHHCITDLHIFVTLPGFED